MRPLRVDVYERKLLYTFVILSNRVPFAYNAWHWLGRGRERDFNYPLWTWSWLLMPLRSLTLQIINRNVVKWEMFIVARKWIDSTGWDQCDPARLEQFYRSNESQKRASSFDRIRRTTESILELLYWIVKQLNFLHKPLEEILISSRSISSFSALLHLKSRWKEYRIAFFSDENTHPHRLHIDSLLFLLNWISRRH